MEQQPKLKDLSDPNAVLKAIEEWNEIGESEFFNKYSHRGKSTGYDLVYNEKLYPPKAIAGAAYYHQFGVQLKTRFKGGYETNNKINRIGIQYREKA